MIGLTSPKIWDVAIVGAGPAGATTAISLLKHNADLRVCLIDRQKFPRDKACGDGLSPGVVRVLTDLGINNILHGFDPVTDLIITSPRGYRFEGPLPRLNGNSPIGYVIPRYIFDNRLRNVALDCGAQAIESSLLTHAVHDPDSGVWSLDLRKSVQDSHRYDTQLFQIRTRVLIGADGARSAIRQILGVPFNTPRYTGIAIRAYSENVGSESARPALQLHFTDELLPAYGWVFPVDSHKANVGVVIDAERYKSRHLPLHKLLERFYGLRVINELGPHWTSPRDTKSYILPYGSELPPLARGAAALVGDAASMINPLTGDGISYAMVGGQMLGEMLSEGFGPISDLHGILADYDQRFRSRFKEHLRANYRLKRMASMTYWNNAMIKAYSKDSKILSDAMELIMGEGRHIKLSNTFKILLKGIR